MTARSVEGWPRWLAALLLGLLLILATLIASWLLRTCVPVAPSGGLSLVEAEPLPPAPAPPDPTPGLKVSLDDAAGEGGKLAAERVALEAEIRQRLSQCRPVEPSKPPVRPPVVQAQPPPAPPLPADRWAQKDLGLLQGCWRLGHDTRGNIGLGGRTELCEVKAGRICFGSNGGGERQSTANCPGTGTITCTAPITARFGNDGTLGTTQPAVACNRSSAQWTGPPNSLTCHRVSDTLALCRDRQNFEYEFRRE